MPHLPKAYLRLSLPKGLHAKAAMKKSFNSVRARSCQDGSHSEPPHLLIACAFLALPGAQARLRESSLIGQFLYYPTFWVLEFWESPTIALSPPARVFRKNLLHQQIRRSGSSWDKFRKMAKLPMCIYGQLSPIPMRIYSLFDTGK